MSKKDGSLIVNLINLETEKILFTILLEKVKLSPEMSQAMTHYATQMQMAQIVKQIQKVKSNLQKLHYQKGRLNKNSSLTSQWLSISCTAIECSDCLC